MLGDPRLSLLSSGATLASNTAWGDAANAADIATTIGAVGAFPLATTSDDAAILIELSAGIYSAVVDGADGGTGTALVEIYRVPLRQQKPACIAYAPINRPSGRA